MKRCPKCGQTYTDKDLNFCYNDGELLSYMAEDARPGRPAPPLYADDPPATEFMGSSRVTSETKWNPPQAPPAVWQGNPTAFAPAFGDPRIMPSQALATVSMILGIISVAGFCCYSGFYLAPPAIIMGIIALVQINKDPMRYGGKGMAIAGIATGAVSVIVTLLFILLFVAASA